MIITRTPFRVSFFGGGTDYPTWYREHGGAVLATTIDKYCYINCRHLPPFFDFKYRTVYSKIELCGGAAEIEHPSVRACLQHFDIPQGMEIVHNADIPARTGMGSSSSFTVGLLHALNGLQGHMQTKRELALEAIHLEQNVMKENVGSQDQVSAAFGGFNLINFADDNFEVHPVTITGERVSEIESHLMLFYTGMSRIASEISKQQIENIPARKVELMEIRKFVDEALRVVTGNGNIEEFGRLLLESWRIKRRLSDLISTDLVDDIMKRLLANGAIGGKLLGAGGGGFVLAVVRPDDQPRIKAALKDYLHVPFRFENRGSEVVFYRHP